MITTSDTPENSTRSADFDAGDLPCEDQGNYYFKIITLELNSENSIENMRMKKARLNFDHTMEFIELKLASNGKFVLQKKY